MRLDDLTDYQRGIASLVRCGLTNREIGAVLNIAPGSVANTLATIYSRLGICGPKGAKRVKLAVMVVQEKSLHHRDTESAEKSDIYMAESGR